MSCLWNICITGSNPDLIQFWSLLFEKLMLITCRTRDSLPLSFSGSNHKWNLVKSGLQNIAKKSHLLFSSILLREKIHYISCNKISSQFCFTSIKIPPNHRLKSLCRQSVKSSASGNSFPFFCFILCWCDLECDIRICFQLLIKLIYDLCEYKLHGKFFSRTSPLLSKLPSVCWISEV